MVYFEETVCGGDDAAGGGCGAPMGVRKVSFAAFEHIQGPVAPNVFEHLSDEVPATYHSAPARKVVLVFRACVGCRE